MYNTRIEKKTFSSKETIHFRIFFGTEENSNTIEQTETFVLHIDLKFFLGHILRLASLKNKLASSRILWFTCAHRTLLPSNTHVCASTCCRKPTWMTRSTYEKSSARTPYRITFTMENVNGRLKIIHTDLLYLIEKKGSRKRVTCLSYTVDFSGRKNRRTFFFFPVEIPDGQVHDTRCVIRRDILLLYHYCYYIIVTYHIIIWLYY